LALSRRAAALEAHASAATGDQAMLNSHRRSVTTFRVGLCAAAIFASMTGGIAAASSLDMSHGQHRFLL
jgi:hypothetical protein